MNPSVGDRVGSASADRQASGEQAPEGESEPLSIGEVLAVLTEEFPDVTVSKIRFLESQGLVNPDRNASGYRQFDDGDIERLRWILRQQRDKFLPLKVIKRALDNGIDVVDAGADQPTLWTAVADDEVDRIVREGDSEADGATARSSQRHPAAGRPAERSRHSTPADVVAALQEDPRPKSARGSSGDSTPGTGEPEPASQEAVTTEPSVAADEPARKPAPAVSNGSGAVFDRDELLAAASLDPDTLDALEEFGLVVASDVGGEPTYDDSDLLICLAAARCAELGLGPRHLRIFKVSAVREAGLVEQLVMPLVKQRNPEARAEAGRRVTELTDLGARVHAALLARELGPLAPERR